MKGESEGYCERNGVSWMSRKVKGGTYPSVTILGDGEGQPGKEERRMFEHEMERHRGDPGWIQRYKEGQSNIITRLYHYKEARSPGKKKISSVPNPNPKLQKKKN